MLEKFINLKENSILYTQALIAKINKHLDDKDRIEFMPVLEIEVSDQIELLNLVEKIPTVLFDNYSKQMSSSTLLFETHLPGKLKYQSFKLSNYNKLSQEVNQKIRNYIFEVVDYFKRNGITNFDGLITFVFVQDHPYVYSLNVKENTIE